MAHSKTLAKLYRRIQKKDSYMFTCQLANFPTYVQKCEFGKISPNSQINANKLNTWKPAMLVDLMILSNVTNLVNLAILTNLTIFRQGPKFKRMSSRQGYQQSGKFDEYGEFGKYGEFDDISPNTKIQANELKTRVPTKWRIWQIWQL